MGHDEWLDDPRFATLRDLFHNRADLIATVGSVTGQLTLDELCVRLDQARVTYEVVRGDTLFVIAKQHGVTVDQLRSWNGIQGDLIEVGDQLTIYVDAPPAGATPAPGRTPASRVQGTARS